MEERDQNVTLEKYIEGFGRMGIAYNGSHATGCMYDKTHGNNGYRFGQKIETADHKTIWFYCCRECMKLTLHCDENTEA